MISFFNSNGYLRKYREIIQWVDLYSIGEGKLLSQAFRSISILIFSFYQLEINF